MKPIAIDVPDVDRGKSNGPRRVVVGIVDMARYRSQLRPAEIEVRDIDFDVRDIDRTAGVPGLTYDHIDREGKRATIDVAGFDGGKSDATRRSFVGIVDVADIDRSSVLLKSTCAASISTSATSIEPPVFQD